MGTRDSHSVNLLDLKPVRNLQWETRENGFVVLLVPKFRNKYLAKWLLPLLSRPNIRVKLDAYGSFVWNQCDGETTVLDIVEQMKEEFGEAVEPLCYRVAQFVQKLEGEKFLLIGPHHIPAGRKLSRFWRLQIL